MSRETEFKERMIADSILMTILQGGVYTMEEVGVEGLRRGEESPTGAAFADVGQLKPCAVVVESGKLPFGGLRDPVEKVMGVSEDVTIYFYQMRGHAEIAAARERCFFLFEGERVGVSYEVMLINETDYFPDMGPVKNSTVATQSWQIISIRKPS